MTTTPETTTSHETARRPQPIPSRDSLPFWEGAARGELLGQRCADCMLFRHPPRPMCPSCQSVNWEWIRLSGRGRIAAWMLPAHPRIPLFDYPLVCVLVDLDEGIRIFSNLYECDPDRVRNGMAVKVFFVPTAGDKQVPVFRPVQGERA